MTTSLWNDTASLPEFPHLPGSTKTDVLIIGGGIAGILCAYMLAQEGVDYILVEARKICGGITQDTTAKITSQHGLIYNKLIHTLGKERTQQYLQANEAARRMYKELCQHIPCGFTEADSFVYADRMYDLEAEWDALHTLGYPAEFTENLEIPVRAAGAVRFKHQAYFHPLQFLGHIAKGLRIYENTKVQGFEKNTVTTQHGKIKADKIIVATHFPILNKHGAYFLKMYQQRSYVLALKNTPPINGMYIGAEENSLSFRPYKDLLLLGGGGHRTGKHGGNWAELRTFAQVNYPGSVAAYRWATQDCITLDGIPYIGQYAGNTPNLFVTTGFNKWGMTNAMAGAMLLRDMILERENQCKNAFRPDRSIWHPQLWINTGEATLNLLSPTKRRCPHLGCALKWNPDEHSWDCPCHGSRFTGDGTLIDGPATDDIKNAKKLR